MRHQAVAMAAITPHGDLQVPELLEPDRLHLAAATQKSMDRLAEVFRAAQPEVVVIMTPHGVHLPAHLAVVVAGQIEGSLDGVQSIQFSWPGHPELATRILAAMAEQEVPALAVTYGANDPQSAAFPVDWGVTIPLWCLAARRGGSVPTVVVSPCRGLDAATHYRAGQAIRQALEESGLRAAVIASADQGHGHAADGPYGFTPVSAEFDREMVELVARGKLESLLDIPVSRVEAALADSWWQMLILGGILGPGWTCPWVTYEAPTYFGLMTALLSPPGSETARPQGG